MDRPRRHRYPPASPVTRRTCHSCLSPLPFPLPPASFRSTLGDVAICFAPSTSSTAPASFPDQFPVLDGLLLARLAPSHAPEFHALVERERARLKRRLPWLDQCTSPSEAADFLRAIDAQWRAGTGMQMGIWWNQRLMGMCGFHLFNPIQRSATMAYWLGLEAEGRGLLSACASALVEWAFFTAHLKTLEIHCATQNHRSRATALRLGFHEERSVAAAEWLYDHFVDHVVYVRHASEIRKSLT